MRFLPAPLILLSSPDDFDSHVLQIPGILASLAYIVTRENAGEVLLRKQFYGRPPLITEFMKARIERDDNVGCDVGTMRRVIMIKRTEWT